MYPFLFESWNYGMENGTTQTKQRQTDLMQVQTEVVSEIIHLQLFGLWENKEFEQENELRRQRRSWQFLPMCALSCAYWVWGQWWFYENGL